MPEVNSEVLRDVEAALDRYIREVENSSLAPDTKRTYTRHAETFVRWLNDNFQPGGNTKEETCRYCGEVVGVYHICPPQVVNDK
jgi:hypothetical protein